MIVSLFQLNESIEQSFHVLIILESALKDSKNENAAALFLAQKKFSIQSISPSIFNSKYHLLLQNVDKVKRQVSSSRI